MNAVCVFCGSSSGTHQEYEITAKKLGQFLAKSKVALVYGGAHVGLMGHVADGALEEKGQVFGVIPGNLQRKEVSHTELTKLYVVNSMHERKQMMFDLSNGFIALPGGLGTLDELCEILTWAQLGLHAKPIGLLNIRGFFNSFLNQLDQSVSEGLMKREYREMLLVDGAIEGLWQKMLNYAPPAVEKWMTRNQT